MILDEYYVLANNVKMPKFGFGTFNLNKEKECISLVKAAIKIGIKNIDTAWYYGNHKFIAQAIKESKIKREEIFITTKIWDYKFLLSKEDVVNHINSIMKDLEVDYIDLLLIHWPFATSLIMWEVMEQFYKDKKILAIGVSNFTVKQLEDFNSRVKIKPMVNQIQLHPYLQNYDIVEYCQKNNILVTSWQTIDEGNVLKEIEIINLAKKYNATPAQLCFKWAIQKNLSIIPKSTRENRILENTKLDFFTISSEDMNFINNLLPQHEPKTLSKDKYKSKYEYNQITWNDL